MSVRFRLLIGVAAVAAALWTLSIVGGRWGDHEETELGESLPAGVAGRFLLVDGHRVHVVDRGEGPALLRLNRSQFLDVRAYFRWVRRAQCPVLLVHGRNDEIIPLRAAEALHRSLPNSELVVLDGAGHFAMQDQPERFVEVTERFLRADRAPG